MLKRHNTLYPINDIIEQVTAMNFEKRLALNHTSGPLFSGPYSLLPEFKNTPLGDLLESLGDIGEARLLKLSSGESYIAHADPDDRLHLAIITNPYSFVQNLESQTMYHIPVDGYIWEMDTQFIHVASNFGGRDRIHLNIRALLPAFTAPGYKLSILGGDYDWKHSSYVSFMPYINKAIKQGLIKGIEKVNDRELLLNCDFDTMEHILTLLTGKDFTVKCEQVN